jgi:hypothetical protein
MRKSTYLAFALLVLSVFFSVDGDLNLLCLFLGLVSMFVNLVSNLAIWVVD